MAVSTNTRFNLPVAKYFEVPSQGLLLFAFPTIDLEDFGFIDGENCIFVNKLNFNEKIDEYQADPEQFRGISLKGQELVKTRHLISHRLAFLKRLTS